MTQPWITLLNIVLCVLCFPYCIWVFLCSPSCHLIRWCFGGGCFP